MAIDVKQTIADTLLKLLDKKSVDKITVKELVNTCGISRQGFYYHFCDIMEVVEWIIAQSLQNAVNASLNASTPQEALRIVILTLNRDEKLIRHLLNSQRRVEVERLLIQSTQEYIKKLLRTRANKLMFHASDLDAFIRFHSYGLVGMLLESLDNRVAADELSEQICRILSGEIWNQARICFQSAPGYPGRELQKQ